MIENDAVDDYEYAADIAFALWMNEGPADSDADDANLDPLTRSPANHGGDDGGLGDLSNIQEVTANQFEGRKDGGGWDLYGETEMNGYKVPSNWGGYILSAPGAFIFWPIFGGGDLARPRPSGPGILNLELDRQVRLNFENQAIAGLTGTSRINPNIPETVITATEALATLNYEFYGVATGLSQAAMLPSTVAPKGGIERHHLLPQSKTLKPFFDRAGIDIEDFKIPLDIAKHRLKPDGIHTIGGGNWNKVWKEYFDATPNASKSQILEQLAKMREQFGL